MCSNRGQSATSGSGTGSPTKSAVRETASEKRRELALTRLDFTAVRPRYNALSINPTIFWWRSYTLQGPQPELRSKRVLRPVPEGIDQEEMVSPQPAPIMCSGVLLQREPAHFTGEDDTDAEDWLTSYERVCIHNKWDDTMKLNNVDLYLDKVARLWFRNNTTDTRTWTDFKARFLAAFARPAVRKLQAEQRLRKRAQEENEAYTSYIEDVVDLCRRVNPAMPECDKSNTF